MNGKKKIHKISLKNNFAAILKQSQQIEKYEMNNNSRRSNNESDYNIYKNGRMGCRLNDGIKKLINCQSENWKYSLNTEGNKINNNRYNNDFECNKKLKKNKLTFSYDKEEDEKRFKTLEY